MQDTFAHNFRWDQVGLDCSFCRDQSHVDWPNDARDYHCTLHFISLAIQLGEGGYKQGEWFCKDFSDNGRANPAAVQHLIQIRAALKDRVLYRLSDSGNADLTEIPFDQLGSPSDDDSLGG